MPYLGDDALKLLDLTAEGQPQKYHTMLKDYHRLRVERTSQTDYRELSREETRTKLDELKARLVKTLGLPPRDEPTAPPGIRTCGRTPRNGYTVEKLEFHSRPGGAPSLRCCTGRSPR